MMAAHQKTAWPADRVKRRAVDSLVPYARNSRTHSPEQVDQIAASIRLTKFFEAFKCEIAR